MRLLVVFFLSSVLISCAFEKEPMSRRDRRQSIKIRRDVSKFQRIKDHNQEKIDDKTDVVEDLTTDPDSPNLVTNLPLKPVPKPVPKPAPAIVSAPKLPDISHLILPIKVKDTKTKIFLHANKEKTHIAIKAEPFNKGFKIIAGLDGVLSINKQILTVTSGHMKFLVELDLKNTNLFVKSNKKVKKREVLGETTRPIIISLKKGNTVIPLCLKITDETEGKVEITYTEDVSPNDPCKNS